jgi:hypothetical protein
VRAPLTARGPTDHRDLARHPAHRRSFLRPSTKRITLMPRIIRSKRRVIEMGADQVTNRGRTNVQLHRISSTALRHCSTD